MSILKVGEIDLNDAGNASIVLANSWNVAITTGGAIRFEARTDGTVHIPGSLNVATLNVATITTSTGARVGAVNVQTFNASGTWTKPTGYAAGSRVHVQAWGGGGSGAKASTSSAAAGGGGGAYVERWLNLSQLAATETVTIGAGGASRSVNFSGASGSNTTVGTLITAYGGGGGGNGSPTLSGTGGGQLSQGNIGLSTNRLPGRPYILAGLHFLTGSSPYNTFSGSYAGVAVYLGMAGANFQDPSCGGDDFDFPTPDTEFHGGAGGYGGSWKNGASSVWGGAGGGGGDATGLGGTSVNGGNGGNAGTTGTAGTQPGGGGGSSSSGNSGAGGDGRVIITIFPG